ncbi:E3 ubiquitin-protein ligase TM129 isoform X2 [Leptinotarsa decemlineata]|uniref:E3 ubiquitin-protein ligase TM129 isoform X2 n=1 Tax=Leptinotarsa decemlineata TaxID=7539 RepID=UPI003D30585C
MSPDFIACIVYFLLCICIVYPPTEFVSAGLTLQSIFGAVLGCEHEKFVTFHIRKSCLNLLVYSLLPLGFIILSCTLEYTEGISSIFSSVPVLWKILYTSSIVLPMVCLYELKNWTRNEYENHPIALNISKFSNSSDDWKNVASSIDMEFRRVDKTSIQTSAIVKIIVTENWIIKITPLSMFIVHQSDASLAVKEADSYRISPSVTIEVQYLNIEVKSGRQGVEPFSIRINAGDFKDLRDRVARSITIMPDVKFHQSVVDQFVDVFKDTINENPQYQTNQEVDQCAGCLQSRSNVKIQKLCEDTPGPNNCTNCFCKPMWCADCLAKWFALRQDQEQQNMWLSSKCSCPMCRATFCVLDVCVLEETPSEE